MLDLFKVIHSLSFVVSSLIQCQLLQGTKTKKLNNTNEFVGQISHRAHLITMISFVVGFGRAPARHHPGK